MIFNNKKIDVSKQVCNENIGQIASKISSFKNVRDKLVANQQKIAENANVVMDGRDIGTVVLPNATLKIFLDASIAKRAKRRLIQLNTIGYKRVDVLENLKSNTELFSSTVETKEMFLNILCFFMLLKFKDVNYQIERNFTTDINYYNFL
ncbi:(d)CMP kinase [bacterium]|nr:(d)CMP kinase [bacterium]